MQIDRLTFFKDDSSSVPLAQQIAEALKRGIVDGQLAPGLVLPSVRDFAAALDISRSTAARGMDLLVAQGYVVVSRGSCARVAWQLPGQAKSESFCPAGAANVALVRKPQLSQFALRLQQRLLTDTTCLNVPYTGPALAEMPLQTWRDLLARHCRAASAELSRYVPEPFGYLPLRQAYTAYLLRSRAVRVTEERLAVFASRNLRLDLLARILLNPGDIVAMEDPGFAAGREQFLAAGATVVPITVDCQGLMVDGLQALHTPPRLIYVTPSHQAPTGAVMSVNRRKQLLQYAARHDCYIIEDDYDSEFRYDGRPLPSLQGMDDSDRTIYLSCLWNVMAPVSRLGFMVLPEALVRPIKAAKALVERDISLVEQAALADFISEGHLEKLVRRQRGLYAGRRANLIEFLHSAFSGAVWTAPESAGLDLLVRFGAGYCPSAIELAARLSGLPLMPTVSAYQAEPRVGEYTIAFASMPEAKMSICLQEFRALLSG
jgi:GntR family transcriptional regulator / MocR family aminotransferase